MIITTNQNLDLTDSVTFTLLEQTLSDRSKGEERTIICNKCIIKHTNITLLGQTPSDRSKRGDQDNYTQSSA